VIEMAADVQRRVFRRTVRDLEKAYGDRVEDWSWKRAAPFTLSHSFGRGFAFDMMNRTGLPPRGTASSVFMHKYDRSNPIRFPISYGPVLRIVVDFSDLSHSIVSIPGGQSGRPSSPNYDDILPLYMRGDGVGMEMDFQAVEKLGARRIELMPDETMRE
jgi:penicillin amidase